MNHVGDFELDFSPSPWGMMSFELQMNQRCIGSGHVSTIIVRVPTMTSSVLSTLILRAAEILKRSPNQKMIFKSIKVSLYPCN